MHKLRLGLGIGLATMGAGTLVLAAPKHWELEGSYLTRDADVDDIDVNEDNFSFKGTYYFQSFDPSGKSIHEAPFIDRSSYLSFGVDVEEMDDDLDNLVDTDVYNVSGAFIEPSTGWFGKAAYVDADADVGGVSNPSTAIVGYRPSYDGYALSAGKYIARNTTLELKYSRVDIDGDYFIESSANTTTDNWGIGLKHYGRITEGIAYSIEGSYYFVNLDVAEFDDLDDDPFDSSGEVYDFAFTLYPVRELAVGISYSDADDLQGTPYFSTSSLVQDGLGLYAEWYFTEAIAVSVLYNDQSYDIANPDDFNDPGEVEGDSLTFAAKVRF